MLELIITLAVLALIASMTTLALRRTDRADPADRAHTISDSSNAAVDASRTSSVALPDSVLPRIGTVHPDGSVVADSSLHVDRLSGSVPHAK
jgi:hypothetical protein